MEELDLTPKMAMVLRAFLEDPQKPRYGFELMRMTGQPSGTLYPILARFEQAGLLVSDRENIDPAVAGRPARRFYTITGAAATWAHNELAILSESLRPPGVGLRRLHPEGGRA